MSNISRELELTFPSLKEPLKEPMKEPMKESMKGSMKGSMKESWCSFLTNTKEHGPPVKLFLDRNFNLDCNLFVEKLVHGFKVGIRCRPHTSSLLGMMASTYSVTLMYSISLIEDNQEELVEAFVWIFSNSAQDMETKISKDLAKGTVSLRAMIRVIPTSFGSPYHHIPNKTVQEIQRMAFDHKEYLLNNKIFSDVSFVVGDDDKMTFHGHSFVIGVASSVLSTMMFPSLDSYFEKKQSFEFPDVRPSAFMSLLRFIYRKEIVIERTMIEPVLYAAEKFNVKFFLPSLEALIKPDTVLDFFTFVVDLVEDHYLSNVVWPVIDKHFADIVSTTEFLELSPREFKHILEYGLEVDAIEVYKAYVKWAEHQCRRKGLPVNDQNRRQEMPDIRLIRFPTMTREDFNHVCPHRSNILTSQEKIEILKYISGMMDMPTSGSLTTLEQLMNRTNK